MNIRDRIFQYWQKMSITSKFALGGRLFLVLIVMVAATGYFSLLNVRKADKSILVSSEIQRLVLEMDRGKEKSHRLYYTFLLKYPVIGFEEAHQQYIQPSIRQIARVIRISQSLKHKIEQSNVSMALQKSHIDLNLYLSSAKRFAQTSIDSVELVTELSAPARGFEAQLVKSLGALEKELIGHETLLILYHEMKSHIQEYRIVRKRFVMQSAFNVAFALDRQIGNGGVILDGQKKKKTVKLLDASMDVAKKILETDAKIKSIVNDFSLQEKTMGPISNSLVRLAMEEVEQARGRIASTHKVAVSFMGGIALLGLFVALGIGKLLNVGITEKLVRLTKSARKFRKGNLDVVVDEGGGDEIGQLANTFNIMAARINELVHGLESKVEQRTSQLQKSNTKLQMEIDDRIKAQARLKETQSILQAALENSQAGILIADAKSGNVRYINEVGLSIMGESRETIPLEFNIFTYVRKFQGYDLDGKPIERGGYPLAWVINHGKPLSKEYLIKQPNMPDRFVWANASPIMNDQGVVHAGISLFLDITKRKKAEQEKGNLELQLRQVHKMEAIGTLAGGIAHDFNNLLAAIIGYADLAQLNIPDNNPAKLHIEAVLKAGDRAKNLVQQILSFSRKSQLGRVPVQISPILKEAVNLLRASIPTTIDIRMAVDSDCRSVLADQTQLHQVIINLCTNGAQSMEKEGGVLDITLTRCEIDPAQILVYKDLKPGPHVRLAVKDTGHGIEQQILESIFDPYFTTKKIGKGSGMGLAMVHGIVKRHRGMILVDSVPGRGTVFQLFLPELPPGDDKIVNKDENKDEKKLPMPTGTEHILVVDDEVAIVDMTRMRLERLGYMVTSTTNSMDALELFGQHPHRFDLVITDQTMPLLTGEKMAKKMIRIQNDIPIILSTGYSSRIDENKIKGMGIRALLMKPVAMKELAECIRRVLGDPGDHQ